MNLNNNEINTQVLRCVTTLEEIIPNFKCTNEVIKALGKLYEDAQLIQRESDLDLVYDSLDMMDDRDLGLNWTCKQESNLWKMLEKLDENVL